MTKTKETHQERVTLHITEIPIESNLGLLAYGDIAFAAWRERKKQIKLEGKNDTK